jgi:protease-4
MDSYGWFAGLVAERRKLTPEETKVVADGRVFTGAQAREAKLVDQIGGPEVAIRWLEQAKGVARDLPVRDWKPSRDGGTFGLAESLAASVTRGVMVGAGLDVVLGGGLALDGLTSVWHPGSAQKAKEIGGIGQ